MKLHESCKIEACVSTDELRPGLLNVRIENGHATAMDGRCLAIVPVEMEEGDTEGWVQPEAFRAARKASKKAKLPETTLAVNGSIVLPDGVSIPRTDLKDNPPNYSSIFPDEKRVEYEIGVDVSILSRVADALGTDKLRLRFTGKQTAILVNPLGEYYLEGGRGLVMPYRIGGAR